MIRLRAFAAQAEAEARWACHRNSARPAVTATSAHPREVRQCDADVDLPRRKSRRAVSPRTKPIAPAMPVSSLVPEIDIYDGRTPILPVQLKLLDFPGAAVSSSEEDSLPVSPRPPLLHKCSLLRGVRCLLRLLGLFLVAMFIVLARCRCSSLSRGLCLRSPAIRKQIWRTNGVSFSLASTCVAGVYCFVSLTGGVTVELPGAACSYHFFNGHFNSHFGALFCDYGRVPAVCRPIQAGPTHA